MIPFWKAWFLTRRTFIIIFSLALPAIISVWVEVLYPLTLVLAAVLVTCVVWDTVSLWRKGRSIHATRCMDSRMSNGEHNSVDVRLVSTYPGRVRATVIDELPVQLQVRNLVLKAHIEEGQPRDVSYTIRPVERGVYAFGAVNVFAKGHLGFVERRFRWEADREVAVYPSVMELKRAEMHAFSQRLLRWGARRQRRLGHTMEFEKIQEYVSGDDLRSMNWKATARTGTPMINLFQDERSQDVIAVVDAGRVMRAPFNGMTSLDYAVNAALAFSNVVIKKHDYAGLITYDGRSSNMVPPSGSPGQLGRINEMLYGLTTKFEESDDERLVLQTRSGLRQRALIMLYTNIDAMTTLKRRLPLFSLIAKRHVLVVVMFENMEVRSLANAPIGTVKDVYAQMVAREQLQQKRDIAIELRHYGIHSVLAPPEKLSISSIDHYLELKSRGIV